MKRKLYIAALLCSIALISGCGKQTADVDTNVKVDTGVDVDTDVKTDTDVSVDTGADVEESIKADTNIEVTVQKYDFTLAFAGDINFDENWSTMQYYNEQANGIYDCISQELIDDMNEADIMWINNEFTYSENGSPMADKAYTFRASPARVDILNQLGVDVAGLANNHIYDYGETAFLDTLDTLTNAGIKYVGAGKNLTEAMTPLYMEVDGKTVAYVAASRAEKNIMTPQAGESTPGILRCYDTELFKQEIAEAKAHADFVIACVHWGTEYSTTLEDVQTTTAREYLDAGADAIIGAHSHCLQGMEFYDGKPIIYSLGNFWFNEKTLDTMLLELHITGEGDESQMQVQMIPATQTGHQTIYAKTPEEQQRIYEYMESISVNAAVDDEGYVTER